MSKLLEGKRIFLTGGSGFLGEYFVKSLHEAGAKVKFTYFSNKDASDALVAEIGSDSVKAVQLNVVDRQAVQDAMQVMVDEWGGIDVLVNNAALDAKFESGSNKNATQFEEYPVEVLRRSMDVNIAGYVVPSQVAVGYMREQKQGMIVNVSSIYGIVGPDQRIYPNGTQKPVDYAVTKGAIGMLTKWLASTYGVDNVRASTLTLGGVLRGHDEAFKTAYGNRTPMGRMMNPEEVGGPLVFLASDGASYVSGSNLIVDGGWSAW